MVFDGFNLAIAFESISFTALAGGAPAPAQDTGPTLDDALQRAEPGPAEVAREPVARDILRESTMLDLWVEDTRGIAARPLKIGVQVPEVDSGLSTNGLLDVATVPFEKVPAHSDLVAPLNYDPEQYGQELANWYGFDYFGLDQLSDRLEEWGRQIQDWVHSIVPGGDPEIVVVGPSGVEFGDDFEVVFHGDGLISLFRDDVFLHGLEATTSDHATIVVTISNPTYQGGLNTPRGGVEVQTGGGSTITYYFRPGQ